MIECAHTFSHMRYLPALLIQSLGGGGALNILELHTTSGFLPLISLFPIHQNLTNKNIFQPGPGYTCTSIRSAGHCPHYKPNGIWVFFFFWKTRVGRRFYCFLNRTSESIEENQSTAKIQWKLQSFLRQHWKKLCYS